MRGLKWACLAQVLILALGPNFSDAATNRAPTISGTPATTVAVGTRYRFYPSARDADRDRLSYKISGKPAWAWFSSATGVLSGTPSTSQVGKYSNIVISVTDSKATTSLRAFRITVTGSGSTNRAPTISRTPGTSVQAGTAYNFRPSASDADGDAIRFSITNKPVWAAFSSTNGQLSGTPSSSQTGSTSGILIAVNDGKATTSLPAFTITVTAAGGTANGTATLNWYPPTANTDGSALTNLSGYKLYHGISASAMTDVRSISSPGITTYVFDQLATGTHYFAISAMNSAGVESANSAVGSKAVP
jgi:hypothetical protein